MLLREESPPGNRLRRAWIIDDSKLEAELARRALAADHHVEVFHDSSLALEQLTSRAPPEVLILDWVMPGLSGIDVCEFVRERAQTRKLPVLLLTANQQTAQIVEGLSAGANDYLAKPFAPAELRARVAALLRSRDLLERAEHAEGLLRRVLSELPDAVLTVDPAGRITFANGQLEEVLGAAPGGLAGKPLEALFPQLVVDAFAAPPPGQATLGDFELEGRVFSPRVSIAPGEDGGNTTITLRDVTEVRAREVRRIDFYSMIAHDLRSPLSALEIRALMLLRGMRGEVSQEVQQELTKMIARVKDLVQIVNDFLDVAQMESARFKIENVEVDLARICAQVYDEYLSVAAARGIELSREGEGEGKVRGDLRRLTQVVGNLVANALKFTPKGGRVALRLRGQDGGLNVAVQDTGRGIPPEAHGRLFKKYERIDEGVGPVEGTGLGLVIVKEIVEAHGGTVGVRSQAGSGSTFWFWLPAA